ncbi:ribosome assembly protein METTL17, mitochondrial [Arctopsyche grandis]|uniref:ribosome assembly protein METTL17, mitochondrial n=1 Tax=Arctopsyche grandis TaxID=121162 RepID=UPI00406D6521
MMNHNKRTFLRTCSILKRYCSVKIRKNVEVEQSIKEKLENDEMKFGKHPGIQMKNVHFPENISLAVQSAFVDTPMKAVENDSLQLANYLKCRHAPPENWEIRDKRKNIINNLLSGRNVDTSSKSKYQLEEFEKDNEKTINWTMKQQVYSWKAVLYDRYTSLKYLLGRSSAEYAVLRKIFQEIKSNAEDFTPSTFHDFGSGVGTGTWALNDTWQNYMKEYVTVDISTEMNDLAKNIITQAYKAKSFPIQRFHQKRYLSTPASRYDIVLCAYSLFEMPSAVERLRTLLNLWKKTEHFLVLVEHGSNAGFSILNEARDFIIENSKYDNPAYVFAPCPHENQCPRYLEDATPCNFQVRYTNLNLLQKNVFQTDTYSYIVLRRGNRPDTPAWPRIVRPKLARSRHMICRMCCSNGKLEEVIVTASKHGKTAYRCAKKSQWGDRLPVTISDKFVEPTIKQPTE